MPDWQQRTPSIVFLCDDVEKSHRELSAKGVKFLEEPQKMPFGTFVKFADNDGNEFLLKS